MEYLVIQRYRTNYPSPITLVQGESFIVGEKYNGPEKWDNWYFCTTLDKNSAGWVPEQLIEWKEAEGIAKEDYTAKELNVDEGERLIALKELNGWIWCRRVLNFEEGWVPRVILKPVT